MNLLIEDLALIGVPIAALTAIVVEALKRAGMQNDWAPWAAFGVATALAGMAELVAIFAWLEPVARVIVAGLVLGLASSGGYSWAREAGRRKEMTDDELGRDAGRRRLHDRAGELSGNRSPADGVERHGATDVASSR